MMILNFDIFNKTPQELDLKSVRIINTINSHSYCISRQNKEFDQALRSSDILLPDGIGIVWAAKLIYGQKIRKIAGFDIFIHLMHYLDANARSCFFLGASEQTLVDMKERANKEFPNVTINTFSPPFRPQFTKAESMEMCEMVNRCRPTVLFVGMTAPKQEKWVQENKDQLNADIICSIGAVFDFYSGRVKRPGLFWIKLGLEWLPRFLKQPRRLAQRNLVSTPKFILEVFSYKLFGKGTL